MALAYYLVYFLIWQSAMEYYVFSLGSIDGFLEISFARSQCLCISDYVQFIFAGVDTIECFYCIYDAFAVLYS